MKILALIVLVLIFPPCGLAQSIQKWDGLISRIEAADISTLSNLPNIIIRHAHEFKDSQSRQLSIALSISLIKNPIKTLEVTDKLATSKDILVERFSTEPVCWLPIIMEYSKKSTLLYYRLAVASLTRAGLPAKACLSNMQATFEEVMADDARGKMPWGSKEFTP